MADGVGGKLSTRFFAAAAPICTKHHVCVRSPNVFLSLCTEHKSAGATKKSAARHPEQERKDLNSRTEQKKKSNNTMDTANHLSSLSCHTGLSRPGCMQFCSVLWLALRWSASSARPLVSKRKGMFRQNARALFCTMRFFPFSFAFFLPRNPESQKIYFLFFPRALARSQLFFLLASAERWREKNGPPLSRLLCTSQHHHRHRHQFFLHVLTQHVEYIVGTASPPPTTTRGPPLFFRISVGARRAGQPAARKKTSTHEQRAKVRIFQLPSLINWRGSSFPRGGKFWRNILTVSQSNFGSKCV